MATQPDEEFMNPEPDMDDNADDGGIGAGTLATAGLGLIALAILIWFISPRFGGNDEPSQPVSEQTPAATTAIAELVTATPVPPTITSAPTEVTGETQPPSPVQPSPTTVPATATLPIKVQEGVYAKVVGTEIEGLSFRSGPGLNYARWDILVEGEIIEITGGPEETDDMIWWRGVTKTGLVGWAVEQYLVPVEPPAWTPEPERTPDLTTIAATPESP